ncbi:MAG: hypothetical protein J0L82_10095 [Deltaproteobacteria bacterium]|jgi:hypothetical protein|nr:hypothetical protein [Deltaproteobacteria bacterium]
MKPVIQYWLRSRFIREEVLRLGLIIVLGLWAVSATVFAVLKKDRTILIGVADDASYVISDSNEALRRKEIVSFVRSFIENYYVFTPSNHAEKISRAGDIMASALWESKRADLKQVNERLKTEPLVQTAKILSIDLVDRETIEAALQITILKRIETISTNLKVTLTVRPIERTETNPWPFEITEVRDETL